MLVDESCVLMWYPCDTKDSLSNKMQINRDSVSSQIMFIRRLSFAGGQKILVMYRGAEELDFSPLRENKSTFLCGFHLRAAS